MNPTHHRLLAALGSLLFTLITSTALPQTTTPQTAQPAAPQNPLIKGAQDLASAGKHTEALELYRKAMAADPKLAHRAVLGNPRR